jgi:hypothetical protein
LPNGAAVPAGLTWRRWSGIRPPAGPGEGGRRRTREMVASGPWRSPALRRTGGGGPQVGTVLGYRVYQDGHVVSAAWSCNLGTLGTRREPLDTVYVGSSDGRVYALPDGGVTPGSWKRAARYACARPWRRTARFVVAPRAICWPSPPSSESLRASAGVRLAPARRGRWRACPPAPWGAVARRRSGALVGIRRSCRRRATR